MERDGADGSMRPKPGIGGAPVWSESPIGRLRQLMSCAELPKCVFDPGLAHCPNCGSELKVIAAILDQPVIEKILKHLPGAGWWVWPAHMRERCSLNAPSSGQRGANVE
jgi:hypothetical protein